MVWQGELREGDAPRPETSTTAYPTLAGDAIQPHPNNPRPGQKSGPGSTKTTKIKVLQNLQLCFKPVTPRREKLGMPKRAPRDLPTTTPNRAWGRRMNRTTTDRGGALCGEI